MDERRGGRCVEENKSGYLSGSQPSCHEWEDLEYGVLAQPETFGGWIWGGVALIASAVLLFLQEKHR